MPFYANRADAALDRAINEWKRIAIQLVSEINENRNDISEFFTWHEGRTRDERKRLIVRLWDATAVIVDAIGADYPALAPSHFLAVHDAIASWLRQAGNARPPGRAELETALEQAVLATGVIESGIRARLSRTERRGAGTSNSGFIPNQPQKRLLDALDGRALRSDDWAKAADVDRRNLFREKKELEQRGLITRHRKLGFYRPDRPPPELAAKQGG